MEVNYIFKVPHWIDDRFYFSLPVQTKQLLHDRGVDIWLANEMPQVKSTRSLVVTDHEQRAVISHAQPSTSETPQASLLPRHGIGCAYNCEFTNNYYINEYTQAQQKLYAQRHIIFQRREIASKKENDLWQTTKDNHNRKENCNPQSAIERLALRVGLYIVLNVPLKDTQ